jgi:hypothetical protein
VNRSADALGTDRSFASAGDRVFKGNRADRSEVKLDALLRGPAKSIASVDVLHRILRSAAPIEGLRPYFRNKESKADRPESRNDTRSEEKKAAQQSCRIIGQGPKL